MAVSPAIAVLQLSHHGRAWNLLRRTHAACCCVLVARPPVQNPLAFVADHAQLSSSLYSQYRWMDDSRNWPAALGGLRSDPRLGRVFKVCFSWEWLVYPARIHGLVHRAFDPFYSSRIPHYQPGSICPGFIRPAWRTNDGCKGAIHGIYVVL